jgi:type III restriction enzyme
LKRICRQWLDDCLVCKGGTYPAQLMRSDLADDACERIQAAITRAHLDDEPVQAVLDPFNPIGSTRHVNFTTSRTQRYRTESRCHLNFAILDSTWEGEFCRVLDSHPQVLAWVKNRSMGFDVPYQFGGTTRRYIPDFIVRLDCGLGPEKPLHVVVEVKGLRGEDAKAKADAMDAYWVPAINGLKGWGRWGFVELRDPARMREDFDECVGRVLRALAKEEPAKEDR